MKQADKEDEGLKSQEHYHRFQLLCKRYGKNFEIENKQLMEKLSKQNLPLGLNTYESINRMDAIIIIIEQVLRRVKRQRLSAQVFYRYWKVQQMKGICEAMFTRLELEEMQTLVLNLQKYRKQTYNEDERRQRQECYEQFLYNFKKSRKIYEIEDMKVVEKLLKQNLPAELIYQLFIDGDTRITSFRAFELLDQSQRATLVQHIKHHMENLKQGRQKDFYGICYRHFEEQQKYLRRKEYAAELEAREHTGKVISLRSSAKKKEQGSGQLAPQGKKPEIDSKDSEHKSFFKRFYELMSAITFTKPQKEKEKPSPRMTATEEEETELLKEHTH